jgi:hypothetical protein
MMTGVGNVDEYKDAMSPPLAQVARPEIILEGLDRSEVWKEIHFLYKPGDVASAPPWVAPHQPRLDWQMWFAALGSYQNNPWLISLIDRLLEGDNKDVIDLLDRGRYPFKESPPIAIRARIYRYEFTRMNSSLSSSIGTKKKLESLNWWLRSNPKEYLPPLEKNNPSVRSFLTAHGINSRSYSNFTDQYKKCISTTAGIPHTGWKNLIQLTLSKSICSTLLLRCY